MESYSYVVEESGVWLILDIQIFKKIKKKLEEIPSKQPDTASNNPPPLLPGKAAVEAWSMHGTPSDNATVTKPAVQTTSQMFFTGLMSGYPTA